MAYDIFISYASGTPKDKMTADAVCATLEKNGIRCWIAPRDILAGEDWGEAIIGALSEVRGLVLIFSASANHSPQIKREVERAVHRGIPVIPFRIEDVMPSKALEYFISTPHWLDAMSPPLERHLGHLANSVRVLLSRPLEKEAELAPPLPHPEVPSASSPPSPVPATLRPRVSALLSKVRRNLQPLQRRLQPLQQHLGVLFARARQQLLQDRKRRLQVVGAGVGVLLLVLFILLLAHERERYPGLSPQAVVHLLRAESLYDERELEPAMNEYTRAIEIEPDAAPAFTGRALARIEKADFEAAVADASRAIELAPELAQAYAARAHAWAGRREYDKALADASKALELDGKNSRAHVVRSLVFAARLDSDNAFEEARKAVKLDEDSPWPYLARAGAHLARQDFDKALEDYNRAIQLVPESALPYIGRARFYLSKGQLQEALADANKAIELGSTVAEALVMRANVRLAQQDYKQAMADASEALRIDPVNPEAYAQRALAHVRSNEPRKALEDANEAIRLDDRQPVAFLARALVHKKRGGFDEVIADASKAIDLDARLGEAYLVRGLAYAAQEKRDLALKDLESGTRLKGGGDAEVARVYATLLLQTRQYAQAISLLNDALHQHSTDAQLYETLSTAHLMAGNLESAELAYRKGLALDSRLAGKFDGVPLSAIQPGSQAERLGLKPGDLLLVYDTALLPTFSELVSLTRQPGGDNRELKVVRGREVLTFQVAPGPLGVRMDPAEETAGLFGSRENLY